MGKELELKYRIDSQAQYSQIRELLEERYPGGWTQISMATSYYDTADRYLARRHWTLRIRAENDTTVLTCKTPAEGNSRNEWEVPEGSLPHGLVALVRRGAPEELMELHQVPLVVSCGARFTRRCRLLDLGGTTAELALDGGSLLGGRKELPFWELELELKTGNPQQVYDWCEAFARETGLEIEPRSKFARASALDGE